MNRRTGRAHLMVFWGFLIPLFIIILVVYLIAGGLYAFLTPAWQAPDEPAHYNYVRHLTTKSGFPELSQVVTAKLTSPS